jgi:peroxiredoxin
MLLRFFLYAAVLSSSLLLGACDSSTEQPDQTRPPAATTGDKPTAPAIHGDILGQPRPGFQLKDTQGKLRDISEWDGKILVINFWATWCPPCVREMPMFVEMQDTHAGQDLQFVGVAIDDQAKVRDFMDTMGVNYPMLIGSSDAIAIAKQYGNRFGALPYTVIVDRQGVIRYTQRGELLREVLEQQLTALQ